MTPASLLAKADTALRSAEHLLSIGDVEGSADRAYYSLFHAARAVLASAEPNQIGRLKTHASVIAAFGLIGVRALGLPPEHGRLLNFAENLRLKADYDAEVFADTAAVQEIISGAQRFLTDIHILMKGTEP